MREVFDALTAAESDWKIKLARDEYLREAIPVEQLESRLAERLEQLRREPHEVPLMEKLEEDRERRHCGDPAWGPHAMIEIE